ncbi:MAG: cytochrome-c oxidase [Rhodospirillaceae bacterium]|mgnify:FL=1|jgi:cytochrome c oxidase subunit 3|nr:cytochrome-c oxidase [Rhodospirillaceae bacterium]MBT3492067.1 cytochrome-c oxidase [Rhodospirillaceae bacterium]MBT3781628.1 cytochrome-c oxidase [Rhodospirillaceae bacterium]MBT3979438.1 cytochrome-c oxidase [Rhodospirillaceae bacterium]MBT4169934.1 cytochrome-c oxidase [Rhodospirillaceae bacterium]
MNLFQQLMEKPWLTEASEVVELRDGRTFAMAREKLGLRVFLVVAMVVFSLFAAAYVERMVFSDWNSIPIPWLLWLNTLVLVLSSVAMHRAWGSARRGRIEGVRLGLYAGGAFALLFLAGQLLSWRGLVAMGYYADANPANAFFYLLTALHGIHLGGGLVAWVRTMVKVRRGDGVPQMRLSIELCTVYWHFLLLIWLVLFALMLLT